MAHETVCIVCVIITDMEIEVKPGKYVAAVSGGVDSMVLLNILRQLPDIELVVAHFDHGIRSDSAKDCELVKGIADIYNLPFFSAQGRLGQTASEDFARQKRYDFLRSVQKQTGAAAIITAHHQDDAIETAIINLIRGSGRKGLSSLSSGQSIIRPLLSTSKQDILAYAKSRGIKWREDSTNADVKYLRNKIRLKLAAKLNLESRQEFLEIIAGQQLINQQIDELASKLMSLDEPTFKRSIIANEAYSVSRELLACWLRAHRIEFDKKALDRLTVGLKTLPAGRLLDVSGNNYLQLGSTLVSLRKMD